jgi:hypothetical protein
MRVSEEFPSKYLKAADFNGRELKATIDRVEKHEIAGEPKLVTFFRGMRNWGGLEILLYPTQVEFRAD